MPWDACHTRCHVLKLSFLLPKSKILHRLTLQKVQIGLTQSNLPSQDSPTTIENENPTGPPFARSLAKPPSRRTGSPVKGHPPKDSKRYASTFRTRKETLEGGV
mmetsp:Transcript_7042/g.16291  ORF Transcript_7042/g.16291 Transcript_7042/m.16291 type:complete len:104 (+) Transcript_7042:317-628(+)